MNTFVDNVNEAAINMREDNVGWNESLISGIGPTRSFYFVSNEVIRADPSDGFHRVERALVGTPRDMDGVKSHEYPGYNCANRYFRVRTN